MTQPHDHSDTMAFVAVVQHSSFTSAAEANGTTKARISRKVRDLEQRLGTLLLKRSTRRLGLTQADAKLMASTAAPEGRVVITAPAWLT